MSRKMNPTCTMNPTCPDIRLPHAKNFHIGLDSVVDVDALLQVIDEYDSAVAKWPAFSSAHEGFAVLLEEVGELKAHVWTRQDKRDLQAMRKEATQVAAMALCFMLEVCGEETGRK